MNTITIELCLEDRKRIDLLTQALAANAAEYGVIIRNMPDAVTGLTLTQDAPTQAKPEPEPPAEPAKPTATRADVQALVQKLATPTSGKRDAVKRIVNEYAQRVSEIPEDKLDEVMQRLTELGGETS